MSELDYGRAPAIRALAFADYDLAANEAGVCAPEIFADKL
jgi:hypothetical protein